VNKMRCEKCGSKVFFVDETVKHVQVDGEIVKTFPGDLTNANCVRCTYPKIYPEYQDFEEVER
jgi:predicted nucleic-acid-binding Zn-ribbon protein